MSLRTLIYSSSSSPSHPLFNTLVTDNYGCTHSTLSHLSISGQSLSSWVFQCARGDSTLLLLCRRPVSVWQPLLITISFVHPAHTFFVPAKPLLSSSSPSPIALSQCSSRCVRRERGTCVAEPPLSADRLPPMQHFFSPCNRSFSRQGNTSGDVLLACWTDAMTGILLLPACQPLPLYWTGSRPWNAHWEEEARDHRVQMCVPTTMNGVIKIWESREGNGGQNICGPLCFLNQPAKLEENI